MVYSQKRNSTFEPGQKKHNSSFEPEHVSRFKTKIAFFSRLRE